MANVNYAQLGCRKVILQKRERQYYGLSIGTRLHLLEITPNTPAARSQQLIPVNSEIVLINGEATQNLSNGEAVQLIKNNPNPSRLVLIIKPEDGGHPFEAVLEKSRGDRSWGIGIGTRVILDDIDRGGVADSSGELIAGAEIMYINGQLTRKQPLPLAKRLIAMNPNQVILGVKDPAYIEPDTETITLSKNQTGSFGMGLKTEVVIHDVHENSAASQYNLGIGDRITGINGRPTDDLTVEEIQALTSRQNDVTLEIARSNLDLPQTRFRNASGNNSRNASPRPPAHPARDPVTERSGRFYSRPRNNEDSYTRNISESRKVSGRLRDLSSGAYSKTFHHTKGVIPFHVNGGNNTGIRIGHMAEGSPARAAGLQKGDLVLRVNNESFESKTLEEAVVFLGRIPKESEIHVLAKTMSEYAPVQEGDLLFVKAHFNHKASGPNEIDIARGTVYCVTSTAYRNRLGSWWAQPVKQNAEKDHSKRAGLIPSELRANQIKQLQDEKVEKHMNKSYGTASRLKDKLTKSRNTPLKKNRSRAPGVWIPGYERVHHMAARSKRPVVILGAVADIARMELSKRHNRYQEVQMVGADGGSGRKGVIKMASIYDVAESGRYPVCDVTPKAIDRLDQERLYPIVIYLKVLKYSVIRTLRKQHPQMTEVDKATAKKQLKRAERIPKGYSHHFDAVINIGQDTTHWFNDLMKAIDHFQNTNVWVNVDVTGELGAPVDEDDDRMSVVSVPNSDYSCTTVGTNMARSRQNLDELSDGEEHEEPFEYKYDSLPMSGRQPVPAARSVDMRREEYSSRPQQEPVSVNHYLKNQPEPGYRLLAVESNVFTEKGGEMYNRETGIGIVVPAGAISRGVQQELYFSIQCPWRDDDMEPPKVLMGPNGVSFNNPIELKIPSGNNDYDEFETVFVPNFGDPM